MDITIEDERKERNDERELMTASIKEWRDAGLPPADIVEKIKARIFDLRCIEWKTKARTQENYAILQDTEEFQKQERALRGLSSFAFEGKIVQENKEEIRNKKIEAAVNSAMEKFRTAGLPDSVIEQMTLSLRKSLSLKIEKEEEPEHFWCRDCGLEIHITDANRAEFSKFAPRCNDETCSRHGQFMERR